MLILKTWKMLNVQDKISLLGTQGDLAPSALKREVVALNAVMQLQHGKGLAGLSLTVTQNKTGSGWCVMFL